MEHQGREREVVLRTFAPGTARNHQKWQALLATARSAEEAVEIFRAEAAEHTWAPSSARTALGYLIGAARRHTTNRVIAEVFAAPRLPQAVLDQAAALDKKVFESASLRQRGVSKETAVNAIVSAKAAGDIQAGAFLTLWWAHAGRLADTARLHTAAVSCSRRGRLENTMLEGKAVLQRGGPFTIYSSAGPFAPLVRAALRAAKATNTQYLFQPGVAARARAFMATAAGGTTFDARNVRRGSAQNIAQHAPSLAAVRAFTGHKGDQQLIRYLRWGRGVAALRREAAASTRGLW